MPSQARAAPQAPGSLLTTGLLQATLGAEFRVLHFPALPALKMARISESDKAEFTIVSLIDESGGVASLDQILVALYRKTGEISKRLGLNSRLYRMVQKGLIHSVPGKKGVYSTKPIVEDGAIESE